MSQGQMQTPEQAQRALIDSADTGTNIAIGYNAEDVHALATVLADRLDEASATGDGGFDSTVRLLTDERALKDGLGGFDSGTKAADAIEAGVLEVRQRTDRTSEAILRNASDASEESPARSVADGEHTMGPAYLTDDSYTVIDHIGGSTVLLPTIDEQTVSEAQTAAAASWDVGATYNLRSPPYTELLDALRTEIGEDTADDFEALIECHKDNNGGAMADGAVALSLLAATRNGILLYDISWWGESTGLASKATFSRTKTQLEDQGLINTEKVPIDIGRPRLRLVESDATSGTLDETYEAYVAAQAGQTAALQ